MKLDTRQIVVFQLHDQRYALDLEVVERLVRIVEITSLPKAPDIVLGMIDVAGRVIAVVDVRRRFGLPARGTTLSDQIIIARTSKRSVGLVVESTLGIREVSAFNLIGAEEILPKIEYIKGVVRLSDGVVLIHDLESFLSLEEERAMEDSMPRA